MPDETEKKTRAPLKGIALETDVLKKISHQLDRVTDPAIMERILRFVSAAVQEKKLELIRKMAPNGQMGFPAPSAGNMPTMQRPDGELW